jgi:hypothetical protein
MTNQRHADETATRCCGCGGARSLSVTLLLFVPAAVLLSKLPGFFMLVECRHVSPDVWSVVKVIV